MKIGKFRRIFLDRFIANQLTPKEELFALCNAYENSKMLRVASVWLDTEQRFRHLVHLDFSITNTQAARYARQVQALQMRVNESFGSRYREFIYNQLTYSDSFKYD